MAVSKAEEKHVGSPFDRRTWQLGHGRTLEVGPRGHLQAIINVTPDSFSDGGRFNDADTAVAAAMDAASLGAAIVDIGGESTRPGAEPVDAVTEQARVIPVIEELAKRSDTIISIDTYRAETAERGIKAGAHIINDVWGLQKDADLAAVAADLGAGLCIMHTGRNREKAADVVADQIGFLGKSLEAARSAGIRDEAIVLDPGFGFAKDPSENVELIARFDELHAFGFPLVAGTSRKRFVGAISGRQTDERDVATAATTAMLRLQGAAIFRVHNVAFNRDALAMADAVVTSRRMRVSS
ncbi:MAG: dihydropteroate synthase [Pseudomonadota bacterium]